MKILKWALLIIAFPVILLIRMFCLLARIVIDLSGYVTSALILFVLGCLLYCLFKARWTDVLLLTGIEAMLFALVFGVSTFICVVEETCDSVIAFLRA